MRSPSLATAPQVSTAVESLLPTTSSKLPRRYFLARMSTGRKVKVYFEDLGDLVMGIDANDQSFDAYTARFVIADASADNGPQDEFYSQVDATLVDMARDKARFREAEHMAILEAYGIDPSSIDWDFIEE
jgi:hypothetical protein